MEPIEIAEMEVSELEEMSEEQANIESDLLTDEQYFYVIFYSDTAYPLFYPRPESDLIRASSANTKRLQYWLVTIPMCFRANAGEAIEMAKKLDPDVICILGDGAFTDKAGQKLVRDPIKGVVIHTLGMEAHRTSLD